MKSAVFLVLVSIVAPSLSMAAPLPKRVGSCTETFVARIDSRLEGMPDSGSAISFTNGGYQVSYDIVPAINRSELRDKVKVCLTFIPNCSHAIPGDRRGRIYKTTNLRTGEQWTLPDSQHSCGGA